MRISDWSSDVCSSDLLVAGKCRAEFERQIFKKRVLFRADDHVAALHLGQRAQERGEWGDMKLVQRLDRVIKHEPRERRFYRKMEGNEQRQRRGVEVAGAMRPASSSVRAMISLPSMRGATVAIRRSTIRGITYRCWRRSRAHSGTARRSSSSPCRQDWSACAAV